MKHIFFLCTGILFLLNGCEQHETATVTSALYDKTPGTFDHVLVGSDSISIQSSYQDTLGIQAAYFAGKFQTLDAITVFKFSNPGRTIVDSLSSVVLSLTVRNSWRDGTFGFALYPVQSDWNERLPLNQADFLPVTGEPIQVIADTSSALSVMTFTVPPAVIQSWGEYGSFLLKSSGTGGGMAYLASDNSTSSPSLVLISRNATAGSDTTTIRAREGTYLMTGIPADSPVIADADADGYVLSVNIPQFTPPPVPLNGASLSFTMGEHVFVSTGMSVVLYQLGRPFSSVADALAGSVNSVEFPIQEGITEYSADISLFIDSWYNTGTANYGILVKSKTTGINPDYAVLTPADSLTIFYTKLPEVQ